MGNYTMDKVTFIKELVFCRSLFHHRRWGPDALAVVRPTRVYLLDFFCSSNPFYVLLSPYLCVISFLYPDLYVLGDNAWIS